jgi:phage portal protein BeeE
VSLLSRALSGVERRSVPTSTLANPSSELIDALTLGTTYGGRAVTIDSSLRLIPVFSAVELRAGAVGGLPLMVYRRLEQGRERATEHWMWNLLHEQPNTEMAADEVWSLVSSHVDLWGNAFLAKIKIPAARTRSMSCIPSTRPGVVPGRDGGRPADLRDRRHGPVHV